MTSDRAQEVRTLVMPAFSEIGQSDAAETARAAFIRAAVERAKPLDPEKRALIRRLLPPLQKAEPSTGASASAA